VAKFNIEKSEAIGMRVGGTGLWGIGQAFESENPVLLDQIMKPTFEIVGPAREGGDVEGGDFVDQSQSIVRSGAIGGGPGNANAADETTYVANARTGGCSADDGRDVSMPSTILSQSRR
jgi:hypothetical protein